MVGATIAAVEGYYVFRGVSPNTTRLLADKAPAIGFPDIPSISFLRFDAGDLPGAPLGPRGLRATLILDHDPDALRGTLIPASDLRPVSLGIFAVDGAWSREAGTDGNKADILYGPNGSGAFDTRLVGDPGLYRWNITALVDRWILRELNPILAISGVFGNVDLDGRNSYATFHTVGTTSGFAPTLDVAPIPLPLPIALLSSALALMMALKRRKRNNFATA